MRYIVRRGGPTRPPVLIQIRILQLRKTQKVKKCKFCKSLIMTILKTFIQKLNNPTKAGFLLLYRYQFVILLNKINHKVHKENLHKEHKENGK